MTDEQNTPKGKSPYARKGKRPFRYEAIEKIDAARATGDALAEKRAVNYFNNSIQREHNWNPEWRKR